MDEIPQGFEKLFRTSPHLENLGNFYYRGKGEGMTIMIQVQEKNANAREGAHGGFLASVADIALGYASTTSATPFQKLVTTSMTIDYVGGAKVGDWIKTSVDVQKIGKRVAFANCYLIVKDERIVRASAIFQNYGDITSL